MNAGSTLADLTLAEKAMLVSGAGLWETHAVPRLGIRSITMSDGPHGLRRAGPPRARTMGASAASHNEGADGSGASTAGGGEGAPVTIPATCFPPAVALGSSWDPDLCRLVGAAIGREARALGVDLVLGPGINIKRSPLCGRNFEYLSEDPVVSGLLGAAVIEGIQSEGVGACVKHFAVNNQETDRHRVSAVVDERTLREIYLRGFEMAVKQSKPWVVMSAYNRVNGLYASEHPWLLTTVLRGEWGFDGLVVSDWGAVDDRVEGLRAGLDLEMPSSGTRTPELVMEAVRSGALAEEVLDRSAGRVLALVERCGVSEVNGHTANAEAPNAQMSTGHTSKESKAGIDVDTGHALARKAAAQCVVLLKNDGDVLPLDRDASIAVVGELARTPRLQGGGSSRVVPTKVDIPLDEMEKLAGRSLPFAPGYRVDDGDGDAVDGALVAEAKAVAASSRVTVVFVGLPDAMESEGFDREHLELPAGQLAVLEGVVSTGARVVVVLFNGGVVRVSGWAAKVPAVLEAWLLGQAGGGAIADLVFGVENPCGRLAETIPVRLEDNPSFHNFPGELGEVHYGERVFVGYRHYDSVGLEVCFPFGHGLSYTAFDYSDLEVVGSGADEDLTVSVRLQVTNKGERDGREVVQLYIRPGRSVVRRPPRELRRFAKVSLPAGESTVVGFDLGWRDFAYYDVRQAAWSVEPGDVAIEVGASSRDIRLVEHVELRTGETPEPLTLDSPLVDWVRSEKGRAALETALRSAPAPRWPRSRIFGEESLKGGLGFVPLRRLARFPGAGLDPDVLESFVKRWEDGDEGAGA